MYHYHCRLSNTSQSLKRTLHDQHKEVWPSRTDLINHGYCLVDPRAINYAGEVKNDRYIGRTPIWNN